LSKKLIAARLTQVGKNFFKSMPKPATEDQNQKIKSPLAAGFSVTPPASSQKILVRATETDITKFKEVREDTSKFVTAAALKIVSRRVKHYEQLMKETSSTLASLLKRHDKAEVELLTLQTPALGE
jgi:predicted transcriptional regulator